MRRPGTRARIDKRHHHLPALARSRDGRQGVLHDIVLLEALVEVEWSSDVRP
jgi:hypothetical protein